MGEVAAPPAGRRDITPDDALRESEERFRVMSDGLPLIVWVHDAEGRQEFVNRTFEEFFGIPGQRSRGDGWMDLVHPDDLETYATEFAACVRERREFHACTRVRRSDGGWRWIESWGRPRWSAAGEFMGLVGTSADVTDRRAAEAALIQSENRFRELAESVPQLVWTARADGRVDYSCSRLESYGDGWRRSDGGWDWRELIHHDDAERTARCWQTAVESATPYSCEHRVRMADGTYRWHLSRARPVRDEVSGEVTWYGTATDIHDLKESQRALRQADEEKSSFLANVVHELRTPLSALSTTASLIEQRAGEDGTLRRCHQVLQRELTQMGRLVEDLVDFTRLDQKILQLEKGSVELQSVIRAAAETCQPLIESRRHRLSLVLPPQPVRVEGDAGRLSQVLTNLLGNAASYTAPGGDIAVVLEHQGDWALIRVTDTGEGLAPAQLEEIFRPFVRLSRRPGNGYQGLGLGLPLVRQIVELHGGSVHAESDGPGTGSTFLVRLPRGGRA